MPTTIYRVYTYDVWGNADNGYDVNDVYRSGETVEIPDDTSSRDIPGILHAAGILSDEGLETVEVDDAYMDATTIYLCRKDDGMPVCELRPE
jgi:hypothetical protein